MKVVVSGDKDDGSNGDDDDSIGGGEDGQI
jgi:hypothetical protein